MKKLIAGIIGLFLLLLIIFIVFINVNNRSSYSSLDDLKGKKIGVQIGTVYEDITKNTIKGAKLKYYNNYEEMVDALNNKEIDAFALDEPTVKYISKTNPEVDYIPTRISSDYFAFALNKNKRGNEILTKLNEYLIDASENGTLEILKHVWFSDDDSKKVIEDFTKFYGKNGRIILGVEEYNEPFCYIKNDRITGYEVAIIADFCKKYDYSLEVKTYDFSKILDPEEEIDIRASSISITNERKEIFNFSEPTYESGGVFAILRKDKLEEIKNIKKIEDLNNGKVGIMEGTIYEEVANKYINKADYIYYDNTLEMFTDLSKGKLDGIVIDDSIAKFYTHKFNNILLLDKLLTFDNYAFIFKKQTTKVEQQFNEFITDIRRQGILSDYENFWINNKVNEEEVNLDFDNLPGPNGTIKVLVPEVEMEPFVYTYNGKRVGYDYEILYNFCLKYGYKVQIEGASFYEIFNKVANDDYNFGMGDITVTNERAKIIKYSKDTYDGGVIVAIRNQGVEISK